MRRLIMFVSLAAMFVAAVPGEASAKWEVNESKDELTGEVTGRFLVGYSKNYIKGWLSTSTRLMLGVTCSPNGAVSVYARLNNVGFEVHDYEIETWGTYRWNFSRVMFDKNTPVKVKMNVWDGNNDGATLWNPKDAKFIKSLKDANSLRWQVSAFSMKYDQVAEFSLAGFTSAYKKCVYRK